MNYLQNTGTPETGEWGAEVPALCCHYDTLKANVSNCSTQRAM